MDTVDNTQIMTIPDYQSVCYVSALHSLIVPKKIVNLAGACILFNVISFRGRTLSLLWDLPWGHRPRVELLVPLWSSKLRPWFQNLWQMDKTSKNKRKWNPKRVDWHWCCTKLSAVSKWNETSLEFWSSQVTGSLALAGQHISIWLNIFSIKIL